MSEEQPTNRRSLTDIQAILTILARRAQRAKQDTSAAPDGEKADSPPETNPSNESPDPSGQNLNE
ncbi:hypothetical protein K9N68_32480 [Kovacikia minuta CCNUW1]|uniref:hypothetical protein n=1 Tax=Kovacikia minuta TaxID=2931930 RepID=UPI001CCD0BA1|nr:hypothetical protein [Kovacikia minuta]UBF26182.1 hypothetical protein K9N68_32480 [Kovacikia minuta CCNUW1]